ncbi:MULTISPECIES: DUF6402 family protein [Pseudomonas]|uniref:Uncharacterized protein n=1 Tax=Pseudomonas fluorescens TaxID=294 RepID=A0AAE2AC67_PSEFL|nr:MULTISPECIES: DUF6402 family protein [Pseudomonas fluorescens group]KIF64214.1 hypothetical protein QS95_02095 [Pseudomonas fluorescens]MBP3999560.1 hypothetical protein [Pseudomonas koreensis]QIA00626.1 hypothetical protein GZH78_00425 [Pseudomonas fluorescens]
MANTTVKATMSPASKKTGQIVTARKFAVTDIPGAMDKMNWPVAAKLMRYWFEGSPWATADGGMDELTKSHKKEPIDPYVESSIVKMAWVLKFDRANKAFNELKAKWNSPNALIRMRKELPAKLAGKVDGAYQQKFASAREAEKFGYTNTVPVQTSNLNMFLLDELRGALANFNMRVIAEGEIIIASGKISFLVNRLGYYIDDSYDFSDVGTRFSQPLGYWNYDGVDDPVTSNGSNFLSAIGKAEMARTAAMRGEDVQAAFKDIDGKRYHLIQNSDFIEYREKHGKGGDFTVYSDVLYESVTPPVLIKVVE